MKATTAKRVSSYLDFSSTVMVSSLVITTVMILLVVGMLMGMAASYSPIDFLPE